jgi:hypothetical protein
METNQGQVGQAQAMQAQQAQAAQQSAPQQGMGQAEMQALQIGMAVMQNPAQAILALLQRLPPEVMQQIMEAAGVVPRDVALSQVNEIKAKMLSERLDALMPNWRDYAAEIAKTLEMAPQLADDPKKLLKVALPDDVVQGQAMAAADAALTKAEPQAAMATGAATSPGSSVSDVDYARKIGAIY